MSDKKHIDRVFQEKFKDFEASPSPEVWKNIQEKLNKPEKEKRRIIPFWFKLAGVAALLLLFLTVGNLLVNNSTTNKTNTKVVDTESTSGDKSNSTNETIDNSSIANTPNNQNNQENITNAFSESQKETNNQNNSGISNKDQIASDKERNQIGTFNKNNTKDSNNYQKNNVTNPSRLYNQNDARVTENSTSKSQISEENITEISTKNDTRITENTASKNNKEVLEKTAIKTQLGNQNNLVATQVESKTEFNKINSEKQLQELNSNPTEKAVADTEQTEADIEETVEEELNKTDLTIEEAIAANQDLIEEEKDEIINRWQVYANIAPVYYNSMGKGSHIDEQFDNNTKTGEVNTSYGVNVSYNLNKKLSVRTGLSSVNLSYDTNDVIIYESVATTNSAPSALRNINLAEGHETLRALSAENLRAQQIDNSLSPKSNAAISQRISYFEIPMEVNYRIGNNKLGLNLIAGFSSFILDGNEVYSELNDEKTFIGEANNIKSMSFSTNLGVGLDYKFTEKLKFNLEPTFKYQLNAFENTSGSFNPYIIGVYTGFSYKF